MLDTAIVYLVWYTGNETELPVARIDGRAGAGV